MHDWKAVKHVQCCCFTKNWVSKLTTSSEVFQRPVILVLCEESEQSSLCSPSTSPKEKKKRASHKPTRGHTHGTRRPVCHILNSAPALPVLETVNKILATSILIRTSQAIFFKPYSQTWQKHFNCMCFGLLSQIRAKHLLCAIFDRGDNLVNVLSNWKVEFFWDVSETLITGGVPGLVVINILSSLNLN